MRAFTISIKIGVTRQQKFDVMRARKFLFEKQIFWSPQQNRTFWMSHVRAIKVTKVTDSNNSIIINLFGDREKLKIIKCNTI